jgi:hypothetical protein
MRRTVRAIDESGPSIRQADRSGRRATIPRQHGAWAMLATPLLLGVAVSQLAPWQAVVVIAAVSGLLASATAQAWLRARRSPAYHRLLAIFGITFAASAAALVVAWPALLVTLVVLIPATAITLGGARPGTPRDLANSLAQVAQAIVLVPAAAWVSGAWDVEDVTRMAIVAAAFLVGEVLVVRSVLRERGNARFAGLSLGYHAVLVIAAAVALPAAYATLALILLLRSASLPVVQRRWATTSHPLKPVQVGLLELGCSVALVLVAFTVPL